MFRETEVQAAKSLRIFPFPLFSLPSLFPLLSFPCFSLSLCVKKDVGLRPSLHYAPFGGPPGVSRHLLRRQIIRSHTSNVSGRKSKVESRGPRVPSVQIPRSSSTFSRELIWLIEVFSAFYADVVPVLTRTCAQSPRTASREPHDAVVGLFPAFGPVGRTVVRTSRVRYPAAAN